jgi:RNA polymerase sigma factor (sigma-70 family)
MARLQGEFVLRHIRKLVETQAAGALDDRQLLERFATQHDQAAFEALVQRHGPLVWHVCRRVLHQSHDVEDAFQATFLVLARKAAAIRKQDSLSCWLYGVAYRIASKVRRAASRRRTFGIVEVVSSSADPLAEATWREGCTVLDEELSRLPEKYRNPLLLCGLEGKTRDEAAQQLGWSLSTFKRRLEKARQLLRTRLARRGFTFSAPVLANFLFQDTSAALPANLLSATAQAAARFATGTGPAGPAAALAEGVLKSLSVTTSKIGLMLVLVLGLIAAGARTLARQSPATQQADDRQASAPPPLAQNVQESKPAPEPPAPADRYGDPLPPGALARLGTVRFRLGGLFYACAFSPDGKTLAAGSMGGQIHLFEAATGKIRQLLEHSPMKLDVMILAYSPDGQILASGSMDGTIALWEIPSGQLIRRIRAHPSGVRSLAFAADGKHVISGGEDRTVCIFETATGTEVRRFEKHPARVRAAALSPDGHIVATGSDKTVRLWETATGTLIRQLQGYTNPIRSVAFSPDGQLLASGCEYQPHQVILWQVASGKELRRLPEKARPLPGMSDSVLTIAFSPDGTTLATGDGHCNLRLWEVATGKMLRQLGEGRSTRTYTSWHDGGIQCIAFSPDGQKLAWGEDHRLRLWDTRSWQEIHQFEGHRGAVCRVFLSSNGKTLVTGSDDPQQRFLTWDLKSGQPLGQLQGQLYWIRNIDLSPDRKILAANRFDRVLSLWDTTTGKEIRRIELPLKKVLGTSLDRVAFSPDGKFLAGGEMEDNSIRLWETATGRELHKLEGHPGQVFCLAFAPDGKVLASGGTDGMIRLHDLTTGQTVRQFKAGSLNYYAQLAFSPDGKLLASAGTDKVIRLWEAASGKEVWRSVEHPGREIPSLAFSPDGRMVASACSDHVIRIFEVATGQERRRLQGHHGPVWDVAFSPDGKTLASGSADTTALLWDVYGPLRRQRSRTANLTTQELESLWTDLAATDAVKAYEALCVLVQAPDQALPFLKQRVRPVRGGDAERVAGLIRDLDSPRFTVRQEATRALEKLGEAAEPALRKVPGERSSLEVRQRVERILDKLKPASSPVQCRNLRALEVLECWATPEARHVLAELARGLPEARTTREAKASLQRLAQQPAALP